MVSEQSCVYIKIMMMRKYCLGSRNDSGQREDGAGLQVLGSLEESKSESSKYKNFIKSLI